jgi:hypothetical protein
MIYREGLAFLWSYDLSPAPPLLSLSRQQVVSLSQSSCVSPVELSDGRGGRRGRGGGRGKSYDREEAWSTINNSILSARKPHATGVKYR